MQQARKSFITVNGDEKPGENPGESAEQTDEVVRNDEVGTRFELAARVRSGGNTAGRRTPGMRSMKGNRGRTLTNPKRGDRQTTDRGRWSGNDSDVLPFERGAKPTRAGFQQTTARE